MTPQEHLDALPNPTELPENYEHVTNEAWDFYIERRRSMAEI